jgi:ubiquinol-cytochrome c reductase cytochrome b subunit
MAESKLQKLYDWLDERTGIKEITREALDEPIRGGARWAYVFGSVLLFLFAIQVVTGIFLSLYYAPTADHAHASVSYIQKAVPGGALLRGLHH